MGSNYKGLTAVFGTAGFDPGRSFSTRAAVDAAFAVLAAHGVTHLDTAQLYGASETTLGSVEAGRRFTIDTKWKGGAEPGSLQPDRLRESAHASLQKLGVRQVDVFYIHAPDAAVAPREYLPAIDELHRAGVFRRFGLSNFLPDQVREVCEAARDGGWTAPSVFQGNYSAVARVPEDELLPLLRREGIAFYAYSPIAGGFLTKSRKDIEEGKGRFDTSTPVGKMYSDLYGKPAYLDVLAEWEQIAAREGCAKAEMAYRWVSFHSALSPDHGDAIVIGANNAEQLEETLTGLERGPLKDETVKAVEAIWERVRHEAPVDNFNSHLQNVLTK